MTQTSGITSPAERDQPIACEIRDGFAAWLASSGGSLVLTTYQAGKVLLIGWDGRQVQVLLRHFDKPMGLASAAGTNQKMALATRNEIALFANAPLLAPDYLEAQRNVYDGLY